jgi:hypothetical protein
MNWNAITAVGAVLSCVLSALAFLAALWGRATTAELKLWVQQGCKERHEQCEATAERVAYIEGELHGSSG